ncbi:MAG TPA: hypothetical protein VHP58_00040 [Alphaproteobacteria bacterium]|nr:hypothetical protein [Alphaproteobacteria bacterium]
MADLPLYELFGNSELLDNRVAELIRWYPHNVKVKPTDEGADYVLAATIIALLRYPAFREHEKEREQTRLVLIASERARIHRLYEDEDADENGEILGLRASPVLFGYEQAILEGKSLIEELAHAPSLGTILQLFGARPHKTGEESFCLPKIWNAFIVATSILSTFYKFTDFDRAELTKHEPGWEEPSLENLASQGAVAAMAWRNRHGQKILEKDTRLYAPIISLVFGVIFVMRATKYKELTLSQCANQIEITLQDILDNLPLIVIYAAWFEKNWVSLWLGLTSNGRKSQTLTKLMANQGYLAWMPLEFMPKFKMPYDLHHHLKLLRKDFEALDSRVNIGARATTSRPRKTAKKVL